MNETARLSRWAGWSAVAAFLLFSIGNALWAFEQPPRDATGPELLEFYIDQSDRIEVGAPLSLLSIALLGVFASAVRPLIAKAEGDELLANVAFGGALLGLAAGLGAETINLAAATRAGDGTLTEANATSLFDVSLMFGSYAASIGFGLLTFAIGAAALRSGALLPRWLALIAIAIGVGMVTPFWYWLLVQYAVGPSLVIVLILGVELLRGRAAGAAYARS